MEDNPYRAPKTSAPAQASHSKAAIACLLIAVATLLDEVITLGVGVYLEQSSPYGLITDAVQIRCLGLAFMSGIAGSLIGISLGIAALFRRGQKKRFAVLGIAISVAMYLVLALLAFIGL